MKKLDKLIITSFLGPFVLTFLVVVFILLMQHMLKYFDDIIGKDLGWDVLGTLLFYFAIFMMPIALPLAVLLSTLITFGNLGEHFELTAIKSLGVSMTRALVPILGLVLIITGIAFLANNYLVPKAALEAYSLLYDIKQKKPSLDLREGSFYGAIPDVNIKVNKKYPDGVTIKGVVIYDHRGRSGNREVIVADSGRMFTILNNNYLKLELFDGYNYSEGGSMERDLAGGSSSAKDTFSKTSFKQTYIIFDLSSFSLSRTEKKWFQGNRIMRNVSELDHDMDSVSHEINMARLTMFDYLAGNFSHLTKTLNVAVPEDLKQTQTIRDSVQLSYLKPVKNFTPTDSVVLERVDSNVSVKKSNNKPTLKKDHISPQRTTANKDSLFSLPNTIQEIASALSNARGLKSQLYGSMETLRSQRYEYNVYNIQWHKIFANSIACLAFFLIGAPLGSIIKRGGLGVPVLASIIFFILFYVMSLTGEKWAKQEVVSVPVGIWTAIVVLFLFGLVFLRQSKQDARLFESDFYLVIIEKLKRRFKKR